MKIIPPKVADLMYRKDDEMVTSYYSMPELISISPIEFLLWSKTIDYPYNSTPGGKSFCRIVTYPELAKFVYLVGNFSPRNQEDIKTFDDWVYESRMDAETAPLFEELFTVDRPFGVFPARQFRNVPKLNFPFPVNLSQIWIVHPLQFESEKEEIINSFNFQNTSEFLEEYLLYFKFFEIEDYLEYRNLSNIRLSKEEKDLVYFIFGFCGLYEEYAIDYKEVCEHIKNEEQPLMYRSAFHQDLINFYEEQLEERKLLTFEQTLDHFYEYVKDIYDKMPSTFEEGIQILLSEGEIDKNEAEEVLALYNKTLKKSK